MRIKDPRIYRIGNIGEMKTCKKGTLLSLPLQPLAASDEVDITMLIQFLLAPDHLVGNVMLAALMRQELTVATRRSIAIAASCIMTDARSRPDIVHSPNNRFAAFNNFANTFQ